MAGLLSTALVGTSAAHAGAPENPIAGVRFEPRVQLAGQALRLNGTGLRAVAWFKGYAAGLYLAQPAATADDALAQAGAKRLQMRLLVDVPIGEFAKAFHKGVARNTPPALHAGLAERMATFDALLRPLGKVRKGDLVNLDLVPGQGLLFWLNGRQLGGAIPGDDFYAALLRIFLGDHPVDDKLKAGLLGQRA
ncbi:MAG: hypothetical protein A3E25_10720 [Burkholderiales bacterium RIFCSPHIGHO2_12_FULL_69_20]|nr:MAG: hypothetical protein A3E25_10720 [Burkholderiales bacterium RIFCSPHIGHO2_12_FULL_69_20]